MKTTTLYRLHKPFSLLFWPAYAVQMRPYLLFVSGVAGLAGLAAAYDGSGQSYSQMLLPFLAFFLVYGFGQALTDCFQTDTDKLSAPYRPLSQGIISPKDVAIVSGVGLLFSAIILISLHPLNTIFSALAVGGLISYTYFKRNYWWAGPFYNAWIVALVPLMGYLCMQGSFSKMPLPIILLTFFSYSQFVLIGYLKDISADRATGYRTFPVVFGWDATAWAGNVFVAACAVLGLYLTYSHSVPLVIMAIGTGIAIRGQLYAHLTQTKSEPDAAFPILCTVRSFIIYHLSIVLLYLPQAWWIALLFYLLFEITLKHRPEKGQI